MAAKDAQDFVKQMDWDRFNGSRLHQNAVIRSLDVVGEAASELTQAFRTAHPTIAWSEIIGMRNRLIPAYDIVRLDIVWDVVTNELQTLRDELGHPAAGR